MHCVPSRYMLEILHLHVDIRDLLSRKIEQMPLLLICWCPKSLTEIIPVSHTFSFSFQTGKQTKYKFVFKLIICLKVLYVNKHMLFNRDVMYTTCYVRCPSCLCYQRITTCILHKFVTP